MQNYNSLIKKSIKNKYQNSTISNKRFFSLFTKQRENILDKINYLKKNNSLNSKKRDQTLNKLVHFYNSSKNFDSIILKYYQKFEVNLALKKKYKKNFKKNSNIKTENISYIYLGLLISKNKFLNLLQKTNCIIKIIDIVSFNFSKFDKKNLLLFEKLITIEKSLIKKII